MRNTLLLIKIQFLNKDILHESYCKQISPSINSYNMDIPQSKDHPWGPSPCSTRGKKEADGFAKGLGSVFVSVGSIRPQIFKSLGYIWILFWASLATTMETNLIFYKTLGFCNAFKNNFRNDYQVNVNDSPRHKWDLFSEIWVNV